LHDAYLVLKGKIVEHCEVLEDILDKAANSNGMSWGQNENAPGKRPGHM
jgi:hypothetical protein